jgi:hypothetical protein
MRLMTKSLSYNPIGYSHPFRSESLKKKNHIHLSRVHLTGDTAGISLSQRKSTEFWNVLDERNAVIWGVLALMLWGFGVF